MAPEIPTLIQKPKETNSPVSSNKNVSPSSSKASKLPKGTRIEDEKIYKVMTKKSEA